MTEITLGNESKLVVKIDESRGTASVEKSPEATGDVFIPRSFEHEGRTFVITAIGDWAFYGSEGAKSVSFPEDSEVTDFGHSCFGATLTKVQFPPKLKNLDDNWCHWACALSEIEVHPHNDNFVFEGGLLLSKDRTVLYFVSRSADKLVVPPTVREIRNVAAYSSRISTIEFLSNSSLETIGSSAFRSCKNLSRVSLPRSVNSLGSYCFYSSGVETIECENPALNIGKNCFDKCSRLTRASFPNANSITIGKDAFNSVSADFRLFVTEETKISVEGGQSTPNIEFVSTGTNPANPTKPTATSTATPALTQTAPTPTQTAEAKTETKVESILEKDKQIQILKEENQKKERIISEKDKQIKKLEIENQEKSKIISEKNQEILDLKEEKKKITHEKKSLKHKNKKKKDEIRSKEKEIEELKKLQEEQKEQKEQENIQSIKERDKQIQDLLIYIKEKLKSKNDESNRREVKFYGTEEMSKMKRKEVVGRGATSEVVKVEEVRTETKVEITKTKTFALKILHSTKFEDMKNLIREYELLSSLNHPCIVKIEGFSYGNKEEGGSILMKYEPKTLEKEIKNLSNTEKVINIIELIIGMRYLQEKRNMMHRDLKPSNILMSEKNHVRIGDFGLATIEDVEISLTKGIGTMSFMAPELLDNNDYSMKVDQYAIGKIIYFVMTNGEIPKFKMSEVITGQVFEIPKTFPKFVVEMIKSCCAFNPDERPSFSSLLEKMRENKYELLPKVEVEEIEKRIHHLEMKEFLIE